MSGYYPAGVTGNEFEIAGADREWRDERDVYCNNEECESFEEVVTVEIDLESYRDNEWGTWECPTCGEASEYESTVLSRMNDDTQW